MAKAAEQATMPARMAARPRLGETLLSAGLVTSAQLDEALRLQLSRGERLGKILVGLGYLSDEDLVRILCKDAGIPFLAAHELQPQADAAALLPERLARQHHVLPLRLDGRVLVLAMANPFDLAAIEAIERQAGRTVRHVATTRAAIGALLPEAYGSRPVARPVDPQGAGPVPASAAPAADGSAASAAARLLANGHGPFVSAALPAPAPASRGTPASDPALAIAAAIDVSEFGSAAELTDDVIKRAIALEATDIHIEPFEEVTQVRYRVDGMLQRGGVYPRSVHPALMSRIKILSGLDIAETRLPQDGRVRTKVEDRNIDLRVSTFPTAHGEDAVLRVLDQARVNLDLGVLGLEADDLALLREALTHPHGMIPVTGPTGSGKTTTLYSALVELNTLERCIITLEDPIEYEVAQLRQSQINTRAGLTFATGLRSILRHDPDVILVGEMRDIETAEIAMSAALTGHLVLTTLHTTNAAGTVARLVDMGAEPFVLASALVLLASQRLVRLLCPHCRQVAEVPGSVRRRFGLDDVLLYAAREGGCERCRGVGFRGRIGIFEFIPVTPDIVDAIHDRANADEIQRRSGRRTLLQDGMRKVARGATSLDEILRVTAV